MDRWLDLAVESVLHESIDELDLVLVLDGVDIGDAPAWADDPRVRVIENPMSLGPAAAMTAAIAASTSPYLARLDSDDRDIDDRLRTQIAYLDAHPDTVAVSARTYRVNEYGVRQGEVRLPAGPDIRRHLLLSNVVPHSTLVFRRAAAERAGGYDSAFRQMEDYDFILRLAALGPIAQLDAPLVEYRIHSTQTSRGASPTGPHISAIARGRRALARELGVHPARAAIEHAAWVAVQHLRWRGVIKPGHER